MPSVIVNKVFIFGVSLGDRTPSREEARAKCRAAAEERLRKWQHQCKIIGIARSKRQDVKDRIAHAAADAFNPPDDADDREDARVAVRVLVSP